MTPILSILTPSIPKHHSMLYELREELNKQVFELQRQHSTLGSVTHVINESAPYLEGGLSIGSKRQSLVDKASGKYLCFLDVDDNLAPNYVETLVRLCQLDADVVTFRSFIKNDFYWGLVDMSINYKTNEEATPERIIKRPPWHICPVKSEYAKKYRFSDTNYGEDWGWISNVLYHCKTEAHTDQILHSYQHSAKTSEADRITKYQHDRT